MGWIGMQSVPPPRGLPVGLTFEKALRLDAWTQFGSEWHRECVVSLQDLTSVPVTQGCWGPLLFFPRR